MVKICRLSGNRLIEGWNDDQLSELEGSHDDGTTQSGKVILVAVSDLLDEAVGAQPLEHTRHLRRRDALKAWPEGACLEAAEGELAANYGLEEV